ncbi:beta-glucosidase [Acetitomaculum ruminis DSM 5522]|uniref:Beta-glucosidase n=1 Tax=Acetitomaculum ruminis DSM 5522 TaxID=1120918 RepID=A0A1I0YLJ4_9FIRM|nr:glycoside hydrolase family 3 protein [Acetitomaculum ruminis]SFB14051.1 beta-glucosidase [Acetitomaculum ruminis DSM 5522]
MSEIFASKGPDIEQREIKHIFKAGEIAHECMVLLENNGILPLKPGKVALYGNGARRTVTGGTGSGEVNSRNIISIEDGLITAGFEINTGNWLNRQEENVEYNKSLYNKMIKEEAIKNNMPLTAVVFDHPFKEPEPIPIKGDDIDHESKTAIYVLSRISGEGFDRFCKPGDYLLFEQEKINIARLIKNYKNVIVILNIGAVMDLSFFKEIEGISALLLMTQLGSTGGEALVEVLTGESTPCGKTTDTWAYDYYDYPSSMNFSHNESVYEEVYEDGIYLGYRYFDSFLKKPLYPFGYGLSYTEFDIKVKGIKLKKTKATLLVNVKNIGDKYAGKEVVEVYYSAPLGKLDKPFKELIAFKKSGLLEPKEEELLEIEFDLRDMASYSMQDAAWLMEAGDYTLLVGNSSDNLKAVALFNLAIPVKTELLKNLFDVDMELEEIIPVDKPDIKIPARIKKILIDPSDIVAKKAEYQEERKELKTDKKEVITARDVLDKKASLEELVAQLSVEEMANLCVGSFRAEKGSIIGDASHFVPGAAGDSSLICKESRGIKNIIMADGPAGLRLQPHFKTDKNGKLIKGGEIFSDTVNPFDDSIPESETVDYYQYCTSIPIGWGLAQSWNTKLLEEAGDLVGREMEQFNVDLWLAPALNIHRNPLCGRNFEYFSEDPLISGKMAAAITRGVQKHKGKGTTIKHFAANNQEDNRYFVNAHISERALREIYLKGFEIAVKESQPLSIMTSYNLLNGIHTANYYDLIQSAARDEWGFEGMVMTDWFTSQNMPFQSGQYKPKYPISASTGCIFAGNDLQMPGCEKNVEDIIDAVKNNKEIDGFKITKADLQFNTLNILRIVLKTME